MSGKADGDVALTVAQDLSAQIVDIILGTVLKERKRFTDLGALLLSKQVRYLQDLMCTVVSGETNPEDGASEDDIAGSDDLISTVPILDKFERLREATTILQLERPSDWSAMAYTVGGEGRDKLKPDEIKAVMLLRVDFSEDAVAAVCGGLK